jgi:periplasmic protein TonB
MERRGYISGTVPRHMSVFVVICAVHALAIYWLGTQIVISRDSLWNTLEVSFIADEQPTQPPPPPPVPVLMTDAFAESPIMDIPPPAIELVDSQESSDAIHAPPPPDPAPKSDLSVSEEQGHGPLTKPYVISGPKYPQDRYPRASIRNKESGRPVVKICISATGAVQSVDVAQSSGYPRLDAAALDIAVDYVFAPAMREGKAVPVCLPYGIEFRVGTGGLRRSR